MRSQASYAQHLPDGANVVLRQGGLVLGHRTQLVRFAEGGARLALDADRDRCLAMLSVVAGRLRAAEYLLDHGMAPSALMKELGLDASAFDLGKYDPDQPRVPAGSGRESGRWTDDAGTQSNETESDSRASA